MPTNTKGTAFGIHLKIWLYRIERDSCHELHEFHEEKSQFVRIRDIRGRLSRQSRKSRKSFQTNGVAFEAA
jgi:hypothetical protein